MAQTILIVEDDASLRKALVEGFDDAGYTVKEATNGEEGLDKALKDHPNLIILDQLMPKMNGVDMLKRLRQDEWGAKVPVIIATNMNNTEQINEGLAAGATDYIVKSEVDIPSIVDIVKQRLKAA